MATQAVPTHQEAERLLAEILSPASDGCRYPLYRRLREIAPVHRTDHPLLDGWYLISGHANCKAVLAASETVNNGSVLAFMNVDDDGAHSRMNRMWMEYQDDPADHDRIRKLFLPHFTPRAVEAHRLLVRELVASLLDAIADRDEVDIIAEFAFPLPSLVIARALGIPIDDLGHFQEVMEHYIASSAMVQTLDDHQRTRRDATATEFLDLFRGYLEARRRAPQDDLISRLGTASAAAGVSDEELLAQFVFVLIAGHSTTADMIGNALVALDRHPDQRAALARGEVPMRDAVNEFLRYDSSLEVGTRCFVAPMEVAGETIPAGARALLMFHSAHRDPDVFEEPDRLDLHRKPPQPAFPFGGGRYFCLGSALSRIEMEEALSALMARYPSYRIVDLEWQGGLVSHGPKRLVIAR